MAAKMLLRNIDGAISRCTAGVKLLPMMMQDSIGVVANQCTLQQCKIVRSSDVQSFLSTRRKTKWLPIYPFIASHANMDSLIYTSLSTGELKNKMASNNHLVASQVAMYVTFLQPWGLKRTKWLPIYYFLC